VKRLISMLVRFGFALPSLLFAEVTWEGEVEVVMEAKCVKCHQGFFPQAGLKLNSRKNALRGGKSGPAIIPGNADASPMVRQFFLPPTNPKHMPPAVEPQLTEAEIELIRTWIDGGAN